MWQIISIRLHLAQSGCMRVRVLTLCELVMRDGMVVTVIYYGFGGKWCCDDFSPVAARPPVCEVLIMHSQHCRTILGSRIALLSLRSYNSVQLKKCLNVIYHSSSSFSPLFKCIAPNCSLECKCRDAEMQWSRLQMNKLNSQWFLVLFNFR